MTIISIIFFLLSWRLWYRTVVTNSNEINSRQLPSQLAMSPDMNRINLLPPNQASETPQPSSSFPRTNTTIFVLHNHYPKWNTKYCIDYSFGRNFFCRKGANFDEPHKKLCPEKTTFWFGSAERKRQDWSEMNQQQHLRVAMVRTAKYCIVYKWLSVAGCWSYW